MLLKQGLCGFLSSTLGLDLSKEGLKKPLAVCVPQSYGPAGKTVENSTTELHNRTS